MNKVRALLFQAKLPGYLWGEALQTSVFLYNRTPHTSIGLKTPYEAKNGIKPDLSTIRVFGSITYYKKKDPSSEKLSSKADKAILLGFTDRAEIYKLWDIELRKVVYSRDVKILEGFFNSSKINPELEVDNERDTEPLDALDTAIDRLATENEPARSLDEAIGPLAIENEPTRSLDEAIDPLVNEPIRPLDEAIAPRASKPIRSQNEALEPMETDEVTITEVTSIPSNKPSIVVEIPTKTRDYYRGFKEVNIGLLLKENNLLEVFLTLGNEPRTFKQAVLSPDKKEWFKAMKLQVTELEDHNCWILTSLPEGKNLLGGRWVYTLKTDNKGNIIKYKARQVVQGYT